MPSSNPPTDLFTIFPIDFGEKGKKCWVWQDGQWQSAKAWTMHDDGSVDARARDYGPWGLPYPGTMPLETHGRWPADEVAWRRPPDQYQRGE